MAAYLAEPETQALLERCAEMGSYPAEARARLHALGLSRFFAEAPGCAGEAQAPQDSRMTLATLAP